MTYGGADIVEEARRLTQQRLSESAEHRRRTAVELAELNERTVRNLRQAIADLNTSDRQNCEKQEREETERLAEAVSEPRTTAEEFQQGSAELLRQQRDAIHRSVASRQSRNIVTPIDDDGDDEAEYYRRKSWLV